MRPSKMYAPQRLHWISKNSPIHNYKVSSFTCIAPFFDCFFSRKIWHIGLKHKRYMLTGHSERESGRVNLSEAITAMQYVVTGVISGRTVNVQSHWRIVGAESVRTVATFPLPTDFAPTPTARGPNNNIIIFCNKYLWFDIYFSDTETSQGLLPSSPWWWWWWWIEPRKTS